MGGGKGRSTQPTVLPAPATGPTEPMTPAWAIPNPPNLRGTKAHAKKAADEAELNNSMAKIDDLWGKRMTAEEKSISDVDAQIAKERSDANVLGVDYSIADEDRMRRIQAAFGDVWTDAQETALFDLTKRYGNPEQTASERELIRKGKQRYEWDYDISATNVNGPKEPLSSTGQGSGAPVGSSTGSKNTLITTRPNNDDEALGNKSILGG